VPVMIVTSASLSFFSGWSKCTVREEQAQDKADSDDKLEYYFVNHCSEVLSQLPPNVRSTLGSVIAPKRARVSTPREPTKRLRCLRCGLHKSGCHHITRTPRTSVEYCTVPINERFNGWVVPVGPAADLRSVRRAWKRHREENDIREHEDFLDW
jgi:hypothetical protein